MMNRTLPIICSVFVAVTLLFCGGAREEATRLSSQPDDGSVLPFSRPPMGGKAGVTMQESVHKWREEPRRLPENSPNIVIVMHDDAGFGQPSTFGGDIQTPTLSRLAEEGIAYNAFHTTAMCSPTRAALLTGRNHHRVGAGQIAEFANDWDGYTGIIPKSSATFAEVLGNYGYATAAFGKWHNTPVDTLANGPYDRFPDRTRIRLLLRLHRRRDLTVGARSLGEHDTHRDTPRRELRGLPPHRGHGRKSRHLDAPAQGDAPPTNPSSFTGRRAPCTARTTLQPSGPTSTKASSPTAGMLTASGYSLDKRRWAGSRTSRHARPEAREHGGLG